MPGGYLGRLLRLGRGSDESASMRATDPALRFGMEIPPELTEAMTAGGAIDRRISRDEALQVPAVLRGRNLICSTLAGLPLRVHGPDRRQVNGFLLDGNIDPDVPNVVTLAYTIEDLLFEGIAWWRVTQFGPLGFPLHARWVPESHVSVHGTMGHPATSQVSSDQIEPRDGQVFIDGIPVPDREVIRFDSPNPPLLRHAARAIRTALKLDRTTARYADEPFPLGALEPLEGAEPLSSDPGSAGDGSDRSEVDALLDSWEKARKQRVWAYLQKVKATSLQWDPAKLQLADQRQHAVLEIARAMGIDPEDLGVSTTSRTYQNSEHRRQDLTDFTLAAYVQALQQRLSMRDVLPRAHQAKISFDGFLRATTPTRMETYKTGLEVGAYTKEEIRELEDRPPLPRQDEAAAATDELTRMLQQIYLAVGTVITAEEARQILNRAGAGLSGNPPLEGRSTANAADAPLGRFKVADLKGDRAMGNGNGRRHAVKFEVESDSTRITFDQAEVSESFRVNREKRTISGLAVPWGKVARSGFAKWRFAEGSLHWSSEARVKLNLNHDFRDLIGRAIRLQSTSQGLDATFKVARGEDGDRALSLAEDGVLDGFSIEVDFDSDAGDDWQRDPSDESVRLVRSGTLRGVALTGMPAFDDARVASVAASRNDNEGEGAMPKDDNAGTTQLEAPAQYDFEGFVKGLTDKVADSHQQLTQELGKSIGESVAAGVKVALENMHDPQRDGPEPVRAARYQVTREAPIYTFDGRGPSLVRDAWYAQREHDDEAKERIRRFHNQSAEVQQLVASHVALQSAQRASTDFATSTTSSASEIIPPGYRPDLFVPQLEQGRPFVNSLSRGTINNATPFVVPIFGSASGMTGDHSEGDPATEGTLTFGTKTVTPGAISGKLPLTREIVDSSNPAIDQIALNAMREDYARQTEAKVYTLLNGSDGQGGTVTTGFVPSGAQVIEVTDSDAGSLGGAVLLDAVRRALALYPFRRFAAPNRALMSQEATTAFATAKDTTERPLLPSVGAQNSNGFGNAVQVGWFVDGLAHVPAWAITGNTSGDADVFSLNSMDGWAWESPVLAFRFEEKQGPEIIELALFGYFATHLLRPVGLSAIRLTLT